MVVRYCHCVTHERPMANGYPTPSTTSNSRER